MDGRLYLVRHGSAEGSHPGGDGARALTPGGREAFAALARALAPELGLRRIVTSPLTRARQTAALLAEATGAQVTVEPRLASGASDGQALLTLLAGLGPGTALVGHNPEVAQAVTAAGGRGAAVPPGTVAALDQGGRLVWLRTP